MNIDNIKKWHDALLSGEYVQTTEYLCREGQYCCLGVACEVAIKNGLVVSKEVTSSGKVRYDMNDVYLPDSVSEWLGIESDSPQVLYKGRNRSLAGLNDNDGLSFDKIAEIIEENFLNG